MTLTKNAVPKPPPPLFELLDRPLRDVWRQNNSGVSHLR